MVEDNLDWDWDGDIDREEEDEEVCDDVELLAVVTVVVGAKVVVGVIIGRMIVVVNDGVNDNDDEVDKGNNVENFELVDNGVVVLLDNNDVHLVDSSQLQGVEQLLKQL